MYYRELELNSKQCPECKQIVKPRLMLNEIIMGKE